MDAEQGLFAYKEEQILALEATLSSPRLGKYLQDASGDKEGALRRYVLNTSISEAFYTPLQGLEITLRNGLSAQLPRVCRDDWFIAGASPHLLHPLPDMLSEAAGKLAEDRKPVTGPNVIAELSFGFWVTILGPGYETHVWRQGLRHAFPNRPAGIERKQIQGGLNRIRRLRNRIAHHEPILNRKLSFDHDLTIGLTGWMCWETAKWVRAHSRVSQVLASVGWKDPT